MADPAQRAITPIRHLVPAALDRIIRWVSSRLTMLLSRAFALSCDKPRHGKVRRTEHCQPARRSRCSGFILLASRGAVVQQDRGDPRRSERARGAARAAERQADCRAGPDNQPAGDPTCLAVLPADGFRGVSRSPHGQPGVANGRPDVFGTVALRVGRTPLDARWHKVEYSPGPRDRGALRRDASRQGQGRAARGGQLVRQQARPLRRRFGPVRPRRRVGRRPATRSPAAAAIARISPSPSCRCCAAPESPTATFIW